jgi:hypothetical protein
MNKPGVGNRILPLEDGDVFLGDVEDSQVILVRAGEIRSALERVSNWNHYAEFDSSVLMSLSLSLLKVTPV